MHPRNIYRKNPANFAEMGQHYEQFRKHLIPTKSGGYTINFKDPKALRELTVALLDHDFGLKVELPLDRLIPTIPQRLNYVHWIEDLLKMLPNELTKNTTRGIDIGAGASCVYPLLGAKVYGWSFVASEVDEMSFKYACENVKRNNLGNSIHVKLVSSDIVLADLIDKDECYDFCMCNPPFFSDESETTGSRSRTGSRPQPSSVCTGIVTETVTSGGEVEFVGHIIEDSLRLRGRVKWYTTMLGKKSSVATIVSKLRGSGVARVVTTEFSQGRTMRWGVAWTFVTDIVAEEPPKKKRRTKPLEFSFSPKTLCGKEIPGYITEDQMISIACQSFRKILTEFQISILAECEEESGRTLKTRFHCAAMKNTWANQRRKRREAARRLCTKEHENEAAEKSPKDHLKQIENATTVENLNDVLDDGGSDSFKNTFKPCKSITGLSPSSVQLGEKGNANAFKSREHTEKATEQTNHPPGTVSAKSNEYFIEFFLDIGVKLAEVIPGVLSNIFLRMEWVEGQDRNSMYQLYQYFQNRFGH